LDSDWGHSAHHLPAERPDRPLSLRIDWQAYSGETTLSNFSQMAAITRRKSHRDSFLDLTARPENDEFHTAAL
jgi:hypothetical protein